MTNEETRKTKQVQNPNDEGKACELAGTIWTFVLRPSFDIRHSDFDIVQGQDRMRNSECGMRNAECGIKLLTTDH